MNNILDTDNNNNNNDDNSYEFKEDLLMSEFHTKYKNKLSSLTNLKACQLYPNQLLYFPDRWEHGTLNIGRYNAFVSVFIDIQLIPEKNKIKKKEEL